MADIKVIINGQIVELPPQGLNLPLTYSLKDRNGITINTGSRSEYAFELPATKHNDSIFNQFYDPAIYTINEQVFLDASIEVDGMPFFRGRCQLQSANLRQDQYFWQGKSYKVAFFGNNADWATRIGDLLIKDLPYTDHTYSYTDNLAAWYNTYPTNDYKYMPLKLKDYATVGQLDGLEDSHPALFIAGLIDKIFNSIGYTVSSNFFATDFFQRLIMPVPILNRYLQGQYGEDYLNIAAENSNPYLPYAPSGITLNNYLDNQTVTPTNPPNPYSVALSQYVIPKTGFYLVKCYTKIYDLFFTAPSVDCFFLGFVMEDGNPVIDWFWGSNNITVDSVFSFERVVFKNAGQVLDFGYIGGGDAISSPTSYYKADYKIQVFGEAEILDGIQLNPKYLIDPSLKAIDMIKGLSHAFNLVFETNEGSRVVTIEPSDTFVVDSRSPLSRTIEDGFYQSNYTDLTQYIDLKKGGELTSDTKSLNQLRLKWKDDSNDPTVEALNLNQNLGVLEARFNFPVNRFKEGENIIENPFFAPTLVIADDEIAYRGINNEVIKTPMLPIVWAVNYLETSTSTETVTQMLPRLLVSDIVTSGEENGTINVWDGTSVIDYKCPNNYMVDYNDSDGYQTSLSFGDETVNGFPISGLMKRFYLAEMLRIKGGKFLECFVFWDVVMLNNLTFRNKITINNNNYILQEINTFDVAKRQSTKTYFVLDYKEVGAESAIQSTILTAKLNT